MYNYFGICIKAKISMLETILEVTRAIMRPSALTVTVFVIVVHLYIFLTLALGSTFSLGFSPH